MKMKKIYPLMSLLALTLFLSSCLEEGSRNYSESSVVYLDSGSGKIYGKTLTGRIITSNQMQQMQPGTFKFFAYSWDEENGTSMIGEIAADNVNINSDPIDVPYTTLSLDPPTEVEEPDMFQSLSEPLYANDKYYLGDHWLFEYAYEARKGEEASIEVYMVEDPESAANEVLLEIRLIIEGEPETGASLTSWSDIIAVDMSPLRTYFEGLDEGKRDLKIQIQYYNKNSTEPMKLNNTYTLTIGNEA
jgi:hypothetical protein